MCVKAVGIALKLTFEGTNQFTYFQTWFFTVVVIGCCLLQINYLNKVSFAIISISAVMLVIIMLCTHARVRVLTILLFLGLLHCIIQYVHLEKF